jgi:hypothetical protein
VIASGLKDLAMWMRRTARRRRAVLMALAAVGTPGMTLDGLSVAVDLPERDLHSLLVGLVARGRVRRLGEATTIHYRYGGPVPVLLTAPRLPAPSVSHASRAWPAPSAASRTSIPRSPAEPELPRPRARH